MKTIHFYHLVILGILLLTSFQDHHAWATEDMREFTPRVARISYLEGAVAVQRTSDEDWNDATLNLPLMVGDKIYTGLGARAELQLEDAVVIRLGEDTYIHFANLEDTLTRIGLLKGTIAIHGRQVSYARAPVEVQSQDFLARLSDWGHVRLNKQENGPAEVLVRRGYLQIQQGDSVVSLKRGEQLRIDGPSPESRRFETINQEDGFDQWCDMRDAITATSQSRRYINTRVAGYSDLDRYGTWIEVPDYGTVWRPTVVVEDWAPYRDGRWMYYDTVGWTWVSYEPWGWTPYHYGRWVYINRYHWVWVPHREVIHVVHHAPRPVWYPALVSFTYARHGSYFSFSVGRGYNLYDPYIGWFPLGPSDPFIALHYGYRDSWYPRFGYHRSRTTIVNNITIDNSTHIYQNQRAPNAITVLPEDDFKAGNFENRTAAKIKIDRANEIAIGSTAIQKMEEKRVVTTRAARTATGSNFSKSALKNIPESRPIETQRASQTTRQVSAKREQEKPSRSLETSSVRQETARPSRQAKTSNARSTKNTRRDTSVSRARPSSSNSQRNTLIHERPVSPSREALTPTAQSTRETSRPRPVEPARKDTPDWRTVRRSTEASREQIMTPHPERQPYETSRKPRSYPAEPSSRRSGTSSPSRSYSPTRSVPMRSYPSHEQPSYRSPRYDASRSYRTPSYSAPRGSSRGYMESQSYRTPSVSVPRSPSPGYSRPSYTNPSIRQPRTTSPSRSTSPRRR